VYHLLAIGPWCSRAGPESVCRTEVAYIRKLVHLRIPAFFAQGTEPAAAHLVSQRFYLFPVNLPADVPILRLHGRNLQFRSIIRLSTGRCGDIVGSIRAGVSDGLTRGRGVGSNGGSFDAGVSGLTP